MDKLRIRTFEEAANFVEAWINEMEIGSTEKALIIGMIKGLHSIHDIEIEEATKNT